MPEPAEPYMEFIREMTLRIERALREFAKESRADRHMILAELREQRSEFAAHFDEIHAENRAQRQALLSILDRLENGGAAAG